MWVVTMFDLPVDTKEARRAYTDFRKLLYSCGFFRMQYSVYARPCASEENTEVQCKRIRAGLPPDGEVRILTFTDKQFERIQVYNGKKRGATEKSPQQISFF